MNCLQRGTLDFGKRGSNLASCFTRRTDAEPASPFRIAKQKPRQKLIYLGRWESLKLMSVVS